jgi:O-antigen ligase
VGLVVGAASAWNQRLALALTAVAVLGLVCAFRSAAMLMAMIAAVFVEAATVGGIAISRLVAPVALVALIVAMVRGEAVVRSGTPLVWAFAYALWALASGLWTVTVGATAAQLASLAIALVYMLAFAGWLSSKGDLERIFAFLAAASLALGLLVIVDYLAAGSPPLSDARASGGAGDPNFFAADQIVAIPLVLVLAAEMRRGWLRTGLYASVLVAIASVLTTLSRGGLIALGAIVLLTLVLPARTLFRSQAQKVTVVLAVLLAAGLSFQAVSATFGARLDSIFSEGGGSGRLVLWQGAWTAIKERPLTGLGYGGYQSVSNDLVFRTPGVSLESFDLTPNGQVVHSAYLGSAAELGIPGLLLFLGLLISTGRSLRQVASRARAADAWFISRAANALIVSLAGWAIASLFLSSETSRPLWIIVGLALALPKILEQAPLRRDA